MKLANWSWRPVRNRRDRSRALYVREAVYQEDGSIRLDTGYQDGVLLDAPSVRQILWELSERAPELLALYLAPAPGSPEAR